MTQAMTTEQEALFQTILDHPDDDAPRLVYADWLEEHGQPARAEFIRLQIEVAQLENGEPQRTNLEVRAAQLLRAHVDDWRPPFKIGYRFARGFIDWISLDPDEYRQYVGELFRSAPITRLKLKQMSALEDARAISQSHHLTRLSELDLSGNRMGDRLVLTLILSSPHLARLRELNLRDNHLDINAVSSLSKVPLPSLTALDLSANPIYDASVQFIVDSPICARLTSLKLGSDNLFPYANRIHAAGADAIARSIYLESLWELELSDHFIGDWGLAALADSRNVAKLIHLGVAGNGIGALDDSGIEAVVRSPHLTQLQTFDFRGNQLGTLGVRALLGWERLSRMKWVDLRTCRVSDEGYDLLHSSPLAGRVLKLE
jgi:uncharacterized protein (TIGR02996 family)